MKEKDHNMTGSNSLDVNKSTMIIIAQMWVNTHMVGVHQVIDVVQSRDGNGFTIKLKSGDKV